MNIQADLRNLLKQGTLASELDLERALILDKKLRLLIKKQPDLSEARAHLRAMIRAYEQLNWSNAATITAEQINESDTAEHLAEQERVFLKNRKEIILEALKKHQLAQQDLGKILGHGKSYMSELINGINPFSNKDLIILHRLFHIKLEKLIPTTIAQKDQAKLLHSLKELNQAALIQELMEAY